MSDLYCMYILDIYVLFLCVGTWAEYPLYDSLYKIPEIYRRMSNNIDKYNIN